MDYEIVPSKNRYVGFLQLSEDMVCHFTLGIRMVKENDKKTSVHYQATLDVPCGFILAREGDSERLITAPVGSLIGIREIPPLRDLESLPIGTHVRLRLLGTSYRDDRGEKKPRHDIEIATAKASD